MIPLKDLLIEYSRKHLAIPAFNLDSFEIYQAVELAVADTGLPCLVQMSPNEDEFIEAERIYLLVKKANLQGLPIYLNLDHGINTTRLLQMVKLGFDLVHFDGSKMDYSTCLSLTRDFIAKAKTAKPQVLIEAEFNHINPVGGEISPDSFTKPDQAREFVDATHADLLAVSIGNLHGVSLASPEYINVSLLSQIQSALPGQFLTLHGGSGIPADQIASAIKLGIVKININTDLRLKFLDSLKNSLVVNRSEKVYDYFSPVISDLKQVIINKLIQFNQSPC